ncbi:hypothetical protein ABT279_29735 [Amycolatopsis sp. NPDC000673]|uniref:hypothetical protein n=1 Tax=Amycolatopsis sp. NPDC000673 TaxID=3154267 RepID=UPI00331B93D3
MSQQENPVVETAAGAVRGQRGAAGESYRAIPYAAAQIGDVLFDAPFQDQILSGVLEWSWSSASGS